MERRTFKFFCPCRKKDRNPNSETSPLLHSQADESAGAKKMGHKCCSVSAAVCGVIFLILGILVAVYFDPYVNSLINKELIIKNSSDSETFKLWAKPPIVPHLRLYFFNLTNSEQFLNDQVKPIFKEVGPYTYREKWVKVNISFHDNGTVTYQTKKEYYFNRSQSYGDEDDIIHTLNVPVLVAVEQISKMGRLAELALSSMLAVLNETAFVHKTVNELVWGYEDPLINMAKKFLPKDMQMPFDKFGFFYNRNGSTDGIFNVYTGAGDINKYTTIDTFNHSRELAYWNTKECNAINGTDGTSYPPHMKRDETIYMFNENLCRSIPLIYNDTITHEGIQSYRFVPPKDVFAYVSEKPENLCYCVGGPPCIGGGVFNISACKFNISSVLSWPHFYQADEKYLDAVVGLKPDPKKHSLFIDINPELGMPLSAQARVQINFVTMNVSTIKPVANLTSMVFPVLWFEDGVDTLPPDVIALLRKSTFVPKVMKLTMLIAFFALCVLLIVVSISCFVAQSVRSDKLPITRENSADYSSTSTDDGGVTNPGMNADNPD